MRQYWCTSPSNILLRQGCVRQLQSIHERWSLQQNNKSPEVHSCQQNNIENWARCFDLLTSVTCYQRLRYNVTTLQNTQGTAYNTLVVNIADMLSLAELGQSSDITNAFPTATKYALLLYDVKGRSCQSLNRLRYNYACKCDKSAFLFPPTDDAFKQHIRRVDYPVAISIHSHEAKPDLWNPDGNGWQLRNMRLESVMFERDTAPKEVRDLTHLYCIDEDCPLARTCQCLKEKLTCTESCSCNYCDECSNRDHSLCLTIAVTMKMTDL